MIIFVADGRLGNQLFQYAFLNTIAKNNEKIICLNMNELVNGFEIDNKNFININVDKYILLIIRKFLLPILRQLVKFRVINYIKQDSINMIFLPSYKFKKGFLPITFVDIGYFQSERLFDYKKINFTIKEKYIEEAKRFLNKIPSNYTKVFVHVRRGDYVSAEYLGIKGVDLPKSYYMKAIDIISKEVENPFFIFLTDDPNFVECCFEEIECKIISKNSAYTDLAIMTLCEYGIVSNSSFSWWGSYLMKSRKKVIFPKYWTGWKKQIEDPVGIYPEYAEVIEF